MQPRCMFVVIKFCYNQVLDPLLKFIMSQSSSSSLNSSYAEILRTVKVVKTVTVERFSPVKAHQRRNQISSTPAYKRKRCQIESFSPVISPIQVQTTKDKVIEDQSLRFTVRKRKNNSIVRCRRHVSSKAGPVSISSSMQTENKENELIDSYIKEVSELRTAKAKTAILLQIEKEKGIVLRTTICDIHERAEIAISDCVSQNIFLNESIRATKNADLTNPIGVSEYHAEINRAVQTKSRIHNGLLSALKSIKKDCISTILQPKSSNSSQSSSSTKSVTIFSNKLSDFGILAQNRSSLNQVPLNSAVKFLRAPNNKSVKFRVPLEEFLAQGQTKSSNILINVSHEKIEIEIPKSVSPEKVRITQEASLKQNRPDDLNLSLLNISQNNSSSNELQDEWSRFASSKHAIDDDDVGSLLDYDSSPSAEVNIKEEYMESDVSADDE